MQYAIVKDTGEQFKATEGARVTIPLKDIAEGQDITFSDILLYAKDNEVKVGNPLVSGVKVTGVVEKHFKGPKVTTTKFRRREGYRRKIGHRQNYTTVKITGIVSA
ncbi:MAG: 50S ribosomal protein L21 [Planctomycetes bacterium]|nr:50S ribosomal protein L21 [Planctomycetota bacterium]